MNVRVDMYVGSATGTGLASIHTNQPNEDAVNAACGVPNGNHNFRFSYTMTPAQHMSYVSQPLYVWGIPEGLNQNALLNGGNGTLKIPPQVFVGTANTSSWVDLINYPNYWSYVANNSDGYYINFIQTYWINSGGTPSWYLSSLAPKFRSNAAYFESDMGSEPTIQGADLDRKPLDLLNRTGFQTVYTSLNYGWDANRANTLEYYALAGGQGRRLNFVQDGPWEMGGSILTDRRQSNGFTNADFRGWAQSSDGVSTDIPLGYWALNYQAMREGTYSWIRYAHSLGKRAVLMSSPYAAGVATAYYDPTSYGPTGYLATGQAWVRSCEANGATPDIWAIYDYAQNAIPALPETTNNDGVHPANTVTGLAWWLMHHLTDPANYP